MDGMLNINNEKYVLHTVLVQVIIFVTFRVRELEKIRILNMHILL